MAKDILYINNDKKLRAEVIVSGKANAEISADTIAWWKAKTKAEKPEDEVRFVYEALGGLIRTHEEQEVFEKKVEEMKKKTKKK